MIQLEVPEANWSFNFPEHLGECSYAQYVDVCRLLYQFQTQKLTLEELRVSAIFRLLNMKIPKKEVTEHYQSNILTLCECFDSFFNFNEEGNMSLRQEFQHNPLPYIRVGLKKLYGPESYFKNILFGQYVDALNLMGIYGQNPSKKLLRMITATLYTPKNEYYDAKKTEHYAQLLRRVDDGILFGVFLLFSTFQHFMTSAQMLYEGKNIDFSILYKQETPDNFRSDLPGLGMKGTSFVLAESGIMGSVKDIEHTSMWEVLYLMYHIRKNDKDSQKRATMAKNKQK